MIPIRNTIQSRNYPIVNTIIIGLNVILYFLELTRGVGLNRFILTYGLVPARYSNPEIALYFSFGQQVLSFFSFMFLHGGFWHLLGNMWSLYIFGDKVEDRLGPLRYFFFYLLCGWASGAPLLPFLPGKATAPEGRKLGSKRHPGFGCGCPGRRRDRNGAPAFGG